MDAEKAIRRLNKDYQEAIMRQFVYGMSPVNDADKKRGYRAIDALALEMNRNIRRGR
jgi:hypothetical protein